MPSTSKRWTNQSRAPPVHQTPSSDSDGLELSTPPYHGGFNLWLSDADRRVLPRFPCNSATSSARHTSPLRRPEPPPKTSNVSPKPVPSLHPPLGGHWEGQTC